MPEARANIFGVKMIIFAFFCINICIYIIVRRSIHILQNYWFLIGYFFQRTDLKYVFIGVIYCIVFFIWGREKRNIWKRLEDRQRHRDGQTHRDRHMDALRTDRIDHHFCICIVREVQTYSGVDIIKNGWLTLKICCADTSWWLWYQS